MAWSPLCCHGNVTVDISWNFAMSITVQSFSFIQKKSSVNDNNDNNNSKNKNNNMIKASFNTCHHFYNNLL